MTGQYGYSGGPAPYPQPYPGAPYQPAYLPPDFRPPGGGVRQAAIATLIALLVTTLVSVVLAYQEPGRASTTAATPRLTAPAVRPNGPTGVPAVPRATLRVPQPPAATTTFRMDSSRVTALIRDYFNAFAHHNDASVNSLTCARFRPIKGTYIDGNEVSRWQSQSYTIIPGSTNVHVVVSMDLRNPSTGAPAGRYVRVWIVQYENGGYFMCGVTER